MKYFRSKDLLLGPFLLLSTSFFDLMITFCIFIYIFVERLSWEGKGYRMKAIFSGKKLINIEMGYLWSQFQLRMFFQLNGGRLITNDISDLLVSFFCCFSVPPYTNECRKFSFISSLRTGQAKKKVTCKNVNKNYFTKMNDWLPPHPHLVSNIINEIEMKFHVKHKTEEQQ